MVLNSPGVGSRGRPSTSHIPTARADSLAEALGRLARELDQHDDLETLLTAIGRGAVELVPGAEEGSVGLLAARRRVTWHAPIGELPRFVDSVQEEVREGPSLDAVHSQRTVRVIDLAAEDRWLGFATRASAAGAASILSLPLYARGDNLGALNLYARIPNAFTDESEHVGLLYAGHAAIAFAGLRIQVQLNESVRNRDLIGQAKGILMERYAISGERAFLTLAQISQDSNRKLHDIAEELVHTGTLADSGALPPDQPVTRT